MITPNAGMSTCPICHKSWLVTPFADCLMPACGCYGHDVSEKNHSRLCQNCGIQHVLHCDKAEVRRAETPA